MVGKTRGTPHKYFRINGREICSPDFHKRSLKFSYSYSGGKQSCLIISLENGEGGVMYMQSGAFKNQHVSLALSAVWWDV